MKNCNNPNPESVTNSDSQRYSVDTPGYYNTDTKNKKKMRTKRYELVELIVPANTTSRAMFKDLPNLRTQGNNKVQVQAIQAFCIKQVSVSPSGVAMCAIADFMKAYLVLNVAGEEKVFQMPLAQLNTVRPDAVTAAEYVPSVSDLQMFENLEGVDWTKSYVQFGSAPAATAFSILFGVHYTRL